MNPAAEILTCPVLPVYALIFPVFNYIFGQGMSIEWQVQ
jgi:hypothetical protein